MRHFSLSMSDALHETLKDFSEKTNTSFSHLIIRGMQLAMLEVIAKSEGGIIIYKNKDGDMIEIKE